MRFVKVLRIIRSLLLVLPFAFLAFHITLFIFIGLQIVPLRDHNPPTTSLMRLRVSETHMEDTAPAFTPLSAFPTDMIRTVLFAEDGYFFHHWGVSLKYIEHALKINKRLGYTAYGASTITQQLARTLFLSPDKSYGRKYLEMLIAVELEMLLEKDRILELYLNYIELGDHIYGFTDAARIYFNKPLQQLTPDEKLSLITIMPNPLRYTPSSYRESNLLMRRYAFIERYYQIEQNLPPRFDSTIIEN
jgi:membrane peptidoglycan carboxypeptidase